MDASATGVVPTPWSCTDSPCQSPPRTLRRAHMPRLVRGLVLSYAPENVVIEAAGPGAGICAPSGPETRQRSHPRPCLPVPVSLGGLARRGVPLVKTGKMRPSTPPPPVPFAASHTRSPHKLTLGLSCPQPGPITKFRLGWSCDLEGHLHPHLKAGESEAQRHWHNLSDLSDALPPPLLPHIREPPGAGRGTPGI